MSTIRKRLVHPRGGAWILLWGGQALWGCASNSTPTEAGSQERPLGSRELDAVFGLEALSELRQTSLMGSDLHGSLGNLGSRSSEALSTSSWSGQGRGSKLSSGDFAPLMPSLSPIVLPPMSGLDSPIGDGEGFAAMVSGGLHAPQESLSRTAKAEQQKEAIKPPDRQALIDSLIALNKPQAATFLDRYLQPSLVPKAGFRRVHSLPTKDPQEHHQVFVSMGLWSRATTTPPEAQDKRRSVVAQWLASAAELGGRPQPLSLAEGMILRNRAVLLRELAGSLNATTASIVPKAPVERSKVWRSEGLLWTRTRLILEWPALTDWDLALRDVNVLAYTLARVQEDSKGQVSLATLSYFFLHGNHRWDSASSGRLMQILCQPEGSLRGRASKGCAALQESFGATEDINLAQWSSLRAATPFEFEVYSPVYVIKEPLQEFMRQPQAKEALGRFLDRDRVMVPPKS
jgi:hypothetical protein